MPHLAEVTHPRHPNIVVHQATPVWDIPSATSRSPVSEEAVIILAAAQTKAFLVPHVQRNAVSSRKSTYLEVQSI